MLPSAVPLVFILYNRGIRERFTGRQRGFSNKNIVSYCFFILGFSIIFFALGLSASLIGNLFTGNQELIRKIGGVMIVVMGLMMVGLFKPSILMKDLRFEWNKKPIGYLGSVLVGVTYAAGWTPVLVLYSQRC